jgi:site-specific DNA recombinase
MRRGGEISQAKAAIYLRVSTEAQASIGTSLAIQEEQIRAYCKSQTLRVAAVYRDQGQSAGTLKRPALTALLKDAKSGQFSVVCAYKLDRLTRSLQDLARLLGFFEKHGITLASLGESLDTSTAAGRLTVNVLASVAQWEREAIGERIAAALRHKRSRGEVYGSTPYGFERRGKRLVPDERELSVVRRIHRLRQRGRSLHRIAGKLNSDGVPTKNGRRWAASTVLYLINNDLYGPFLGEKRRTG